MEEEPGKANVETEVESMVTVPIHQASSSVPLLSTPIIDLPPPKPMSPPKSVDFEQKNKFQDKTTQALASRIYNLENHDLYSKIDKHINEFVKGVVHNALQAPLCERFKDLSEFQMKEILHDWMFESGSYRSHPDDTNLYEALEVSMQQENNDELHEALATSLQKYLVWKSFDIREAPSRSSKQKPAFPSQQPINDDPILEDMHLLESEDIGKIDSANPEGNRRVHDMSKPLPLGGPPSQVTNQTQYFFNKDLEYLVSGNKEIRHALSISKLKAAYYPDFRLKELEPSLWTEIENSVPGVGQQWPSRAPLLIAMVVQITQEGILSFDQVTKTYSTTTPDTGYT
ncbi:hypothetical protein Tco_0256204 [Tanacetum coccineum]